MRVVTARAHEPVPKQSADRCALRAEVRGDPMLGTAFPASRLLLVEQPGPWGPDGLTESDFEHRVAHLVTDLAQSAGMRVQAIRRPGRTHEPGDRRWAVVDTRDGHQSLSWGRFRDDRDLLDVPLDGSAGTPDADPIYLVCTHGRHDTCCALRGRPVAAALAEARPDRVWETTHVGGDRFAANVLVLASGLLYGRVEADDVTGLLASTEAGEVFTARLRGRVGLAPVAQAALAFGYRFLAVRRGLTVRSTTPITDGYAMVHVDGPRGELVVRVRVEQVSAAGLTCHNPLPRTFVAYRPEAAAAG